MARPRARKRLAVEASLNDPLRKSKKRQASESPPPTDRPAKRLRVERLAERQPQTNQPLRDEAVAKPSGPDAEAALQEDDAPDHRRGKRIKSAADVGSWKYPPEFWDGLSQVPLTRKALEELSRRNKAPRRPGPAPPQTRLPVRDLTTATRELARFAKHGGPDLRHLRGYRTPSHHNHGNPGAMKSSSSRGQSAALTNPTTIPTGSGTTAKTKRTSAYDPAFQQHLADHAVHATYSSKKPDAADLAHIKAALAIRRPSLSPSRFPEDAFEAYVAADAQAKDEEDVMHDVMPTIMGSNQRQDHPTARKTQCTNLDPLTDGTIVAACPDIYWGAHSDEVSRPVRDELSGRIAPSTTQDKPVAPNFFLEAKGRSGTPKVASLQARYDGAVGARAMHGLQSYGGGDPAPHAGRPHAFSATYQGGGGLLQLYSHHLAAPAAAEGARAEYHMNKLRGFDMTDCRETFAQGAAAFRNLRDLAKQRRDCLIRGANERARHRQGQDDGCSDDADADAPAAPRDTLDEAPIHERCSSQTAETLAKSFEALEKTWCKGWKPTEGEGSRSIGSEINYVAI